MAVQSSTLAGKIPWTEEPGGYNGSLGATMESLSQTQLSMNTGMHVIQSTW